MSYRQANIDDDDFLFNLFASSRHDEFILAHWNAEEREKFLRLQFLAQQQHYRNYYADARFEIILLADQPIGRLHVLWSDDQICLVDISLLPEYRGHGIGASIIRRLQAQAAESGRSLRLRVQVHNPAIRLYHRLGFRLIRDEGVYYLLEWLSS